MRRLIPVALLIAVVAVLPVLAQPHQPHHVAMPDTLKWVEPATLPGARLAIVHGDPSKEGLFVYRVKMPAGYKIPPHTHKASENVTVLSGVFFVGLGEKSIRARARNCPSAGSCRFRRSTRTSRGRARRRPWCRSTAWAPRTSRS